MKNRKDNVSDAIKFLMAYSTIESSFYISRAYEIQAIFRHQYALRAVETDSFIVSTDI